MMNVAEAVEVVVMKFSRKYLGMINNIYIDAVIH